MLQHNQDKGLLKVGLPIRYIKSTMNKVKCANNHYSLRNRRFKYMTQKKKKGIKNMTKSDVLLSFRFIR